MCLRFHGSLMTRVADELRAQAVACPEQVSWSPRSLEDERRGNVSIVWGFPKSSGYPQMVFVRENHGKSHLEMDDLGGLPYLGNLYAPELHLQLDKPDNKWIHDEP